jgi:hypothetical protein
MSDTPKSLKLTVDDCLIAELEAVEQQITQGEANPSAISSLCDKLEFQWLGLQSPAQCRAMAQCDLFTPRATWSAEQRASYVLIKAEDLRQWKQRRAKVASSQGSSSFGVTARAPLGMMGIVKFK